MSQTLQIIQYKIKQIWAIKIKYKFDNNQMSLKRQKDKQSRQKNKTKTNTPSKKFGIVNPTPYQQIKSQIQRIFLNKNYKKQHKDSARQKVKASLTNQNNIIKCFMHQPIVNNFISISQDQPLRVKTSLKQQRNKINKHVKKEIIQKRFFNYKYIIGKGGFGKVWKIQHYKIRNLYAMKQMLKSIVLTKKSVQSIINQQKLLSNLNSPFIVNMHYAFQDRQTLYLVLDLMEGGDLRHHLGCKHFNQIQSKFFIACILLGLQYLHTSSIIHRDIKPQNLVLDSRGYIRITDLGIARVFRPQNSSDTSGTPGYMSPEVICRQNHTFVSDLFAVGVIAYELMLGRRPYNGLSRQEIRQAILSKQASIKPYEVPEGWSMDALDFINKLLQRRPQQRLGFRGIQQVKQHPWLIGINWRSLYKKQIQSPFLPMMKKTDFDQDEKITVQDEQQAELIQKNSLLLRKTQFQQLFKQYYFDETEKQKPKQKQRQSIQSKVINLQDNQQLKSRRAYLQSAKSSTRQKSTKESPKGLTQNIINNMAHSLPFQKLKHASERQNSYIMKDYKI